LWFKERWNDPYFQAKILLQLFTDTYSALKPKQSENPDQVFQYRGKAFD
jgi:hypothetical protein